MLILFLVQVLKVNFACSSGRGEVLGKGGAGEGRAAVGEGRSGGGKGSSGGIREGK